MILRSTTVPGAPNASLAQEAHLRLLESVGARCRAERVCYQRPMPRRPFYEFLATHCAGFECARRSVWRLSACTALLTYRGTCTPFEVRARLVR